MIHSIKISILYKKEAEKENINVSCSSGCSVFTSKKDLEDNLVKKTDKGLYKVSICFNEIFYMKGRYLWQRKFIRSL